jgi:hypothetical protein
MITYGEVGVNGKEWTLAGLKCIHLERMRNVIKIFIAEYRCRDWNYILPRWNIAPVLYILTCFVTQKNTRAKSDMVCRKEHKCFG